jgi:hypothetical protein
VPSSGRRLRRDRALARDGRDHRGDAGRRHRRAALEQRTYLGAASRPAALAAPVTVLGIDPTVDGRLHDLVLVAGSALPTRTSTSASSPSASPRRTGSPSGRRSSCRRGRPVDYRVVGIIRGDGPLTGAFGRTVVVPLRTAQAVFAETGVTRVDIG